MVRYFHQSPDYWLDHATLDDWNNIYGPELEASPPTEYFAAAYFKYKPPGKASAAESDYSGEDLANFLAAFPGGQHFPAPE